MDRPKRATRKPLRLIDEPTPEKRAKKLIKENVDPNKKDYRAAKKTSKLGTTVPANGEKEVVVEKENLELNEIVGQECEEIGPTSSKSSVDLLFEVNAESSVVQPAAVATPERNTSGKYEAQYSKTSRASCRGHRCYDKKINKEAFRIGKMVRLEYGQFGGMGLGWWHMECFFRDHSHIMKWTDFNGVEDLSVEDQKNLHLKVCRCPMPVELLAGVIVTHDAVMNKNKEIEKQKEAEKREAAVEKRQENVARVEAAKNCSVEDLIRENVTKVVEKKTIEELKVIVKTTGLAVERTTQAKHGKKKGAPKKSDYVEAVINAEPLSKIGSLVQRAIRKYIKADELKAMLTNVGLPKTGSKTELTKRLLEHLGGDFGEESEEENKSKKKYGSDYDSDDYEFTSYGIYKKDQPHPDIVNSARCGDLESVKEILRKTNRPVATVNASRKWTESEEKWGYDKSWEWHDETPLLAASTNAHIEVVYYLLMNEADPTLKGCTSCDITDTPLSAVQKKISSLKSNNSSSFGYSATSTFTKLKIYQIIHKLISTSLTYWSTASYAHPSYSDARKTAFARQPNKPSDSVQLRASLDTIGRDVTANT